MQNTTPATDTITAAATDTVTAAAKKPVQWQVGVSEDMKAEITLLRESFVGPGVTKPYPMTEKECVDMIWHVANNNRYITVEKTDTAADGTELPVLDIDGLPEFVTVDAFDLESKRVFSLRDTKPVKRDLNSPEAIRTEMARLQAKLASLSALGWKEMNPA